MCQGFGASDEFKDKAARDEEALTRRRDQMESLGQEDLGKYKEFRDTGKITDAQQASLDKNTAVQKTKMRQVYGDAGIGDSTMSKQAEGGIDIDAMIYKGQLNLQDMQTYLGNALSELGVADTAQANLINLHGQLRAEDIAATSAMVTTGTGFFMGSTMFGGPQKGQQQQGVQQQPMQQDSGGNFYQNYGQADTKAQSQGYSSYVSDDSGSSGGGISWFSGSE